MVVRTCARLAPAAVLLVLASAPCRAQETGLLRGTVVDEESGRPLQDADVLVVGAPAGSPGRSLTDVTGEYSFVLPAGTYSVVVSLLGYQERRMDGISVQSGAATQLEVRLSSIALALNPIVVTGRRGREEKALDAPAPIFNVPGPRIQARASTNVTDHVKAIPGVDIAEIGLSQSSVVTRGFNNVFSGALLVMTDNRYASVPSLRVNTYSLIPTSQLDIERMEVLLGPAAALYGPNSANGVLHIITTSPIDDPGTRVQVTGGGRSIFQGAFRSAAKMSEKVGVKVSGTWQRGRDWEFRDPFEVAARADAIAAGADPETLRIGDRDFHNERWSAEGRVDIRPWDDGEVIFSAGMASIVRSIEMTGVGSGMTRDWHYGTIQARARRGRLFAQAFVNKSDAGESFLLRTGDLLVDESRAIAAQIQHGAQLGVRQDFIYGLDVQRTEPRTLGTINGRYEDDDDITEIGGYLHSQTTLTDRLELVTALRVDQHSSLEGLVFSPRAALVVEPAPGHKVRGTFNRAYSTPTVNNLFLDLVAARNPFGVGSHLRAVGVPKSGYTFDETCPDGVLGLCMISPFSPQTRLPARALDGFWNPLIQGLGQANPSLAALVPFLLDPGSQAGDPALQTALLRFNQELAQEGGFPFIPEPGPTAIERMRPTISNTFEIGYKGLLADRVLISMDVYTSRIKDFIGPLRTETPTVHYSLESLGAYVAKRLAPLIQAGAVSTSDLELLVGSLGAVPLGTVAPDQVSPGDEGATDLLITYRNFGDVDLWGSDFAIEVHATDRLTLNGTWSWVNDDCITFGGDESCTGARDIALNAPRNKGALGFRWSDVGEGVTVEGRARWVQGFPMNSGVYIGRVEGYSVVDTNVSYRLPTAMDATVTLTASNLFDHRHDEFVGAPQLGRLLLVRLGFAF